MSRAIVSRTFFKLQKFQLMGLLKKGMTSKPLLIRKPIVHGNSWGKEEVMGVQQRASSGGHYVSDFKPPTMNDLPVPKGSWQDGYNQKQTKFNIQLAAAMTFFVATFTYAMTSGLIDLNKPPKMKN